VDRRCEPVAARRPHGEPAWYCAAPRPGLPGLAGALASGGTHSCCRVLPRRRPHRPAADPV